MRTGARMHPCGPRVHTPPAVVHPGPMDPLTVLALAELDTEYRAVVGRLPERPGRDPELAEAVRRQIEADDAAAT
jgi:hypothetical protein